MYIKTYSLLCVGNGMVRTDTAHTLPLWSDGADGNVVHIVAWFPQVARTIFIEKGS